MSGTVTCTSRTPAGTAAVPTAATGVPATGGTAGRIAGPHSTESPHALRVLRPVPEDC